MDDSRPSHPPNLAKRYKKSRELLLRAQQIIPGGHHLSGRPLITPDSSPMYMERGQGCRCFDVDGNAYIDYFMAFGPFLLGYANEEVDCAAFDQARRGQLLSLNHPLHVDFVERLIARFPGADMGMLFKTGSEATTAAVRMARRKTSRRKIARCGYHGWHDWCLPTELFVPAGLEQQVLEFRGQEPESLRALFRQHPDEIAAVILAPEMIHPHEPALFRQIAEITREHGALFIMDEIKTGFRIAPGSVQQRVGVIPDLTTLSKALGNGWPIAAVIGTRAAMEPSAGMHLSATYHGETAAIAAAMSTLDIIDREPVQEHVWRLGEQLIAGIREAAARHHLPVNTYGEPLPPMPFMRFTHPDSQINQKITNAFYTEVIARGILLHPRHLWFISYAHQSADIEHTLTAIDTAMSFVKSEFSEYF